MSRQASVSCVALAAALGCLPLQAAPRAFVSSTGVDRVNVPTGGGRTKTACQISAPCRTFQAAHNAVSPGGEIVALDTADYGPVAIAKSVAIIGNPGIVAGISVATGNGVTIAAKPDFHVVLRNLHIQGARPFGGDDGVAMTGGNSLTIENCVISNFLASGVAVNGTADVRIVNSVMRGNSAGAAISGDASADVVHSQFMGNDGSGLRAGGAGGTTSVSVSDSVASGNGDGFVAFRSAGIARMSVIRSTASHNVRSGFSTLVLAGAAGGGSVRMTVSNSMASSNGTGFLSSGGTEGFMTVGGSIASGNGTGFANDITVGGSVFRSLGDNLVRQNRNDLAGTITAGSAR